MIFPKTSICHGFSIAMLNNQMVYCKATHLLLGSRLSCRKPVDFLLWWKSTKIHKHPQKSMRIVENPPKSTKIHQNPWKSTNFKTSCWFSGISLALRWPPTFWMDCRARCASRNLSWPRRTCPVLNGDPWGKPQPEFLWGSGGLGPAGHREQSQTFRLWMQNSLTVSK